VIYFGDTLRRAMTGQVPLLKLISGKNDNAYQPIANAVKNAPPLMIVTEILETLHDMEGKSIL